MNEVNKTLFIPLYGKARVSRQGIILNDPSAERIWDAEGFPVRGKSRSKWLAYNMAMRARVFDDWTDAALKSRPDAAVLHIGCGLDSRCARVRQPYVTWIDCDLPDVIRVRKKYFEETPRYHMAALDASKPEEVSALPGGREAVVILEGLSMYLTRDELRGLFLALEAKYDALRVLMDVYTLFGARVSRYKNPVNDVGVTRLYGIDDIGGLLVGTRLSVIAERTFTPDKLVDELKPADRFVFRLLFTGRSYRRFYRLYELGS